MRYAIISDLHANRQALKAVLTDIRSNDVEQILCLGDIIGYGPSPAEVLETAFAQVHHFILGNHDAVVAGKMSADCFNESAKRIIDWTCSALDSKAADFFGQLPLVIKGENLRVAHGEFSSPGSFNYIFEPDDAVKSFNACQERVLFTGHSHIPGLFVVGNSGNAHWLEPQDFNVEEEKRYLVNVGSVGQPRNDDIRASYCIFDQEAGDVIFREVPFDIEAYREDLQKARIDESTCYFLQVDLEHARPPLREIIDFKPVKEAEKVIADEEVRSLEKTVKSLKRTKKLVFALAAILVVLIGAFSYLSASGLILTNYSPGLEIAANQPVPPILTEETDTELLLMPERTTKVSKSQPLDYWSVVFFQPDAQQVETRKESNQKNALTVFQLSSNSSNNLKIAYVPIPVPEGSRFTASAQFKKIKFDQGYLEIALEQILPDGTRKLLLRKEPKNFQTRKGWVHVSMTLKKSEVISQDSQVSFVIRGKFQGEVLVRKCSLKRKE